MLKKSASGVLASLRGSTRRHSSSEIENAWGGFPFAKNYWEGQTATRSAGRTSSPLRCCGLAGQPFWASCVKV